MRFGPERAPNAAVRYRVRPRSDGVIEIRRRSVVHAFLTPDVAVLAMLLCGWAVCTFGLVEALVADPGLTSMVVVLGTGSVSLAFASVGVTGERPQESEPIPPGGRAA